MVTRPAVHAATVTVAEIRASFDDDHVHIALLVSDGQLIGTIERYDLARATSDTVPAREIATLAGRTIEPDAALADARTLLRQTQRRRLAVTSDKSTLVGLLCLKANGKGFCSDSDVAARRQAETN